MKSPGLKAKHFNGLIFQFRTIFLLSVSHIFIPEWYRSCLYQAVYLLKMWSKTHFVQYRSSKVNKIVEPFHLNLIWNIPASKQNVLRSQFFYFIPFSHFQYSTFLSHNDTVAAYTRLYICLKCGLKLILFNTVHQKLTKYWNNFI